MVWYIGFGILALWLVLSLWREVRKRRAECVSKGGDGGSGVGMIAPLSVLLLGMVGVSGFLANEISGNLYPVVPTAWKTETSQLAIVTDHKRSAVTFCVLNEQKGGKTIGYAYLLGGTTDYRWIGLPDNGGEVESVAITAARGSECLLTKTYATKWKFAPGYEWVRWFGRPNRMDHVRYEFKLPNGAAEGYEYNQ